MHNQLEGTQKEARLEDPVPSAPMQRYRVHRFRQQMFGVSFFLLLLFCLPVWAKGEGKHFHNYD